MALTYDSLEPTQPPFVGEAFVDLGLNFLRRSPNTLREWHHQGLVQAVQLEQLTGRIAERLGETGPYAAQLQEMSEILLRRRAKDVAFLGEALGFATQFEVPRLATNGLFEPLAYHYRWQQRSYQCLAWMLELHGDLTGSRAFQTCADNLSFDCGFMQTLLARCASRPEVSPA